MAEVIYASPAFTDGDQQVVLINMRLRHFVEFFPRYDGPSPSGMKGMVESNYGKGNATYFENPVADGDSLPFRYWEISGLNRIWALSAADWCESVPFDVLSLSLWFANHWAERHAASVWNSPCL